MDYTKIYIILAQYINIIYGNYHFSLEVPDKEFDQYYMHTNTTLQNAAVLHTEEFVDYLKCLPSCERIPGCQSIYVEDKNHTYTCHFLSSATGDTIKTNGWHISKKKV